MGQRLRQRRGALFLLAGYTARLRPIGVLIFLLLQTSCNTQISARWRRSESPHQKDQAQTGGQPQLTPATPAAKRQIKPHPDIAAGLKKRALLPESVLARPEIDSASVQLRYDTVVMARTSGPQSHSDWHYRINRDNQIVGFEFSNHGGNRILPQRYDIRRNLLFTRDFQFRFDDRARQDIHLTITDWAPSSDRKFRLSEMMITVLHFFPRNYLPAIRRLGGRYLVTLPTGEPIEFDALTHQIVSGVLSEGPVDLTPNPGARKFPRVSYSGKGVVVRANARGADPRVGTTATITTGSPFPGCAKGKNCDRCQVPSRELWTQNRAVRFKFATDAAFDRYLRTRCGFGVPVIEPNFFAAFGSSN